MMKRIAILALVVLTSCSTVQQVDQAKVHHVVLCWLKDFGNKAQRVQIIEASKSFRAIPGVIDVRVGEVIESDRKIVDDSFDVAVTLSFADVDTMNAYLEHPLHGKTKKEVLLPLVKKIVVYDFGE